ncbi:MAG TPA: DUF2911 domain-containing protein [Thermoanaerobaculia bacterium]|jgi:hypothetical protein
MKRSLSIPSTALGVALMATAALAQQQVDFPRPSPNASVSQLVGITEITLHYSRPGVKNRKIWGGLVPYGQVWRTGANENTTIAFSTPVKIGGHELPAGTYGLQTIPTAGDWTVIFSKDAELWGAFDYKAEHDALRIQATPRPAEPEERMSFAFDDLTDTSATVVLRWERLAVPFTVEVDTPKLVVARAQSRLGWRALNQAAAYCLQGGCAGDEGLRWADASIAVDGNFSNYQTRARLLAKKGDYKAAVAAGEKALAAAKTAAPAPPAAAVGDLETSVKEWRSK